MSLIDNVEIEKKMKLQLKLVLLDLLYKEKLLTYDEYTNTKNAILNKQKVSSS